jgi:hypothetical protein
VIPSPLVGEGDKTDLGLVLLYLGLDEF